MLINTGRWTEYELEQIIREAAKIADTGERIAVISKQFLGILYQGNTLVGDQHTAEELVVNLRGMDCFTYIDYIETMRLSRSFSEVQNMLRQVRYRGGSISYKARYHFFTDWAEHRSTFVRDVTEETGKGMARIVLKKLNRKDDGTLFLSGIEPVDRPIAYIPSDKIDGAVLQSLKTGDYAGIYSDVPGLDVSHVGIIIRTGAYLFLRHASSSRDLRKIVDQDLMQYIKDKPGLIILRPI